MSTQDPGASAGGPAPEGTGRDATTSSHALPEVDRTTSRPAVDVPDAAGAASLLSTEEQAAVRALPPGTALLVVQRGPNQGARFLLDAGRTTAGRNPDSDIFLDDVTVSRRHAEFLREGTGPATVFSVRDAGSLNGTYVNRDRVEEVRLAAGDEVQVGKYRLVFSPSPVDAGDGA
jgi:pSer/pThr/pTyr-binding forkhead associated (FHA) protein